MSLYLFTKAQFESRISAKKVKRIFDDNSDGTPDTDAIAQLRADASSKVMSYLEPMGIIPRLETLYDLTTGELLGGKTLPPELVRLSLDVGVALAAQRHPEVMRQDWVPLMKQAETNLCNLRDGKTSLGGGWEAGTVPQDELRGGVVGIPGTSPEGHDSSARGSCLPAGHWSKMGDFG